MLRSDTKFRVLDRFLGKVSLQAGRSIDTANRGRVNLIIPLWTKCQMYLRAQQTTTMT
jgi:hypothetical protein